MKISIVEDDILKSPDKYVGHITNVAGAMGKGVALDFKKKYPDMYIDYKRYCDLRNYNWSLLKGRSMLWETLDETRIICNMFAMPAYHEFCHWSFARSLTNISKHMTIMNHDRKISFPFMMGCVNAGGHWRSVDNIVKDWSISENIKVTYYKKN